jgi:hypothetical protein
MSQDMSQVISQEMTQEMIQDMGQAMIQDMGQDIGQEIVQVMIQDIDAGSLKYEYGSHKNINNLHNELDEPSAYKEILRYHCINGLNDYFQSKLMELSTDIYDVGELFKNSSCKLIELINRWCWHQYLNPTCLDSVIPYCSNNVYDFSRFVDDLNYIIGVHSKETAIKTTDKIITSLQKNIINYLQIGYNNFSSWPNQELKIIKDTIDRKIRLTCSYKSNPYQAILHPKVYKRLKLKLLMFGKNFDILGGKTENLDDVLDNYIFCLVFRYSHMDSGNQQLSINANIKDMFKKCGVNFELFGSAINTLSLNYCSLFYDIEKYFGSNGNFFDFDIKQGIYWCNPPYDDTIMTNAATKIVNILENTTISNPVAFIMTIPIWDIYTQQKLKSKTTDFIERNYNLETLQTDHMDFQIYCKLKPYIKDELMIPKHRIPYFNYRRYSNINAVNTYMLIIYKDIDATISDNLHKNFDKIVTLDKENFFCK